jgi:hypothetical protein
MALLIIRVVTSQVNQVGHPATLLASLRVLLPQVIPLVLPLQVILLVLLKAVKVTALDTPMELTPVVKRPTPTEQTIQVVATVADKGRRNNLNQPIEKDLNNVFPKQSSGIHEEERRNPQKYYRATRGFES